LLYLFILIRTVGEYGTCIKQQYYFKTDEYHTDESASTYGTLLSLPDKVTRQQDYVFSDDLMSVWIRKKYGLLVSTLTERISQGALINLLKGDKAQPCDFREVITEVMTSRLIRRGNLSTEARTRRATNIKTDQSGTVTFSVLLLPFRTPSPLKHESLLPDLGEFYTLGLLSALAASCRKVQTALRDKARYISDSLKTHGIDITSLFLQPGDIPSAKRGSAISLTEQELRNRLSGKEYIRQRKFIRAILQSDSMLRYDAPEALMHFLLLLAETNLTPTQYHHWMSADIIPVHIYAIQDEFRYPCFDMLDRNMIGNYRASLLQFMRNAGINNELLSLIRYEDIQDNLSWKTRYFNDVEYSAKLQALMVVINASHDLLQLDGRQLYLAALAAKDARLQQLFEPLLFALPYDILERYAREHSLDYGTFYCQFMKNIYTPQNADRELLRRMILTMALHAAARYVAAYESNTAGKNTSGFDDVRSLFPETQRMSIHRKDSYTIKTQTYRLSYILLLLFTG